MTNCFEDSILKLEKIARKLNSLGIEELRIDEKEMEILRNPKKISSVNFPVKTSKGLKILEAHRVQYNDALGPTKGGIRFHPEADLNETIALAFWMTIKNSLLGLPYGGAKGSVKFNPKEFDCRDIEEISREYIRQMHEVIGPRKDIPAPDVYTNAQIMGYMIDELNKIKGEHLYGAITGKPLFISGSEGRSYSTALGAYYVLREAIKKYNLGKEPRVIIEGFGNAGMNIAKFLYKDDFRIIGVSDSKGAVYNSQGLDIEKLIEHKERTHEVSGFSGGQTIGNKEILEAETDILIPAALANSIDKNNAERIRARMIVELSNGPVTSEADEILNSKDIIIIPDVLANAGGVVVSYFEWVQNLCGEKWTEKEVLDKLERRMVETFDIIYNKYTSKFNLDFRTATYAFAIRRILQAEKDKGRL